MSRVIQPINTSDNSTAHCIKADYYKMGLTNFLRDIWGGKKDGFIATGVIEYDDGGRTTKLGKDAENLRKDCRGPRTIE